MDFLNPSFWQEFALKYGALGLAFNSFIEAIFFPIPPDVLLITLCAANPKSAFFYAAVTTLFSTLGGIVGYFIGYKGGKPLAVKFFGEEKVNRVHRLFEAYESMIILTAGFTPLPYKLFTITSGVLYASLSKLILFSIIGRGLRFFAEAALFYFYGKEITDFVQHNLNLIFTISGILLIVAFIIYRRAKKGTLP
ncbi:YqaA family protein [Desulfurobacterium atlanticum]|uniref:Membrane protein YqaA, SNARE-associated domain n=1 Tax=Desulfurobacterium atlanticum TaxID=240169 RepID=A0A238YWR6_9BACT|nr:YqaA family protein [Desulfurobacterium atlanticum]SNR75500.1 membrane protein YqaA, SNARE-associated domain [Desulfurobacterium atlanticum]